MQQGRGSAVCEGSGCDGVKEKKAHVGPSQKGEQFAAGDKVHDHVEVCCILEATPQIDYERMLHSEQHLLLVVCVVDLLGLDDLFLLKHFDGIEPEIMFAPDCLQ